MLDECGRVDGGEGGIRTHVPRLIDNPISSRARYGHFGTSPGFDGAGVTIRCPRGFWPWWQPSEDNGIHRVRQLPVVPFSFVVWSFEKHGEIYKDVGHAAGNVVLVLGVQVEILDGSAAGDPDVADAG